PPLLRLPRPQRLLAQRRTGGAVGLRRQLRERHGRHLDVQVDAVQERPADPAVVALHLLRRALARPPAVAQVAARAAPFLFHRRAVFHNRPTVVPARKRRMRCAVGRRCPIGMVKPTEVIKFLTEPYPEAVTTSYALLALPQPRRLKLLSLHQDSGR